jgi:hypothetical protein
LRVPARDKNTAIGDKLLEGSWATPTRTQNLEEPDTSRPPPAPKDVIERQPRIDPWEQVKDKRYKVDVSKLLQLDVPTDPNHETTHSRHATKYLLFDNYFDYLCSDTLEPLGLPQLDGQEQAMYYWFYRYVKRVLQSLLAKGVIQALPEFPMFQKRRPQVYRVLLPREVLKRALDTVAREQDVIPIEVEQRIPLDAEIKALIRSFTGDPLDTAADA